MNGMITGSQMSKRLANWRSPVVVRTKKLLAQDDDGGVHETGHMSRKWSSVVGCLKQVDSKLA